MKDISHLLRVAGIFVLVVAGFLVVRHFMVPKSFGEVGHYRADAVDEIRALKQHYSGDAACPACHKGQSQEKAQGGHRGVRCESCHGALQEHVEQPKSVKPGKPKESEMRSFCGRCHEKSLSKPPKFPQQNLKEHNPGIACDQCHPAHKPQ
ncbi:MAG: hypothetical protein A2X36_13115 [Elusimicrobia bacterium GWA2_69_24]|nr:MAG: hypothetical protein A2X36_13115 [Elusimicrobia bacterium GWA2_69_24]HBL17310.1 hypothetical protein [Elusimicrobiota bacterium]